MKAFNSAETRAALIATMTESHENLIAKAAPLGVEELSKWIVMCDGIAIDYNGTPGKLGSMMAPVLEATRFATEAEAQAMAAKTVNGLGERGVAVTLAAAVCDSLNEMARIIVDLKRGE